MKKALAAVALAGSIALIGAIPAVASTYPAGPAVGVVSDGSPAIGEIFSFSGKGFAPGEAIVITVGSRTFNVTADANGNFTFQLSLTEAGTFTLTAKGASGHTVTATVTVEGVTLAGSSNGTSHGSSSAGGGLADTGADSNLLIWSLVGGGALAAGITSVVVVRRRASADMAV